MKRSNTKEALLVLDKPEGPTSFDMVRAIRRISGGAKIGHTGTLDPFASGVLVLLLGKATRLSSLLINADKIYRGSVALGHATDTLDVTGTRTEEAPVPELSEAQVREALASFVGVWHQMPPMFSAKKREGVRLYQLARKQVTVERERIPVYIHRLDLLAFRGQEIEFEVHCSKGTYIRSLADELARRLGTLGHLARLRRLACGSFTLDQSVRLEQCQEAWEACLEQGFDNFSRFLVQREQQWRLSPSRLPSLADNGRSDGQLRI